MTDKIDFSENDLKKDKIDSEMRLVRKLTESENYARTFCWLALKFLKEKRKFITANDLKLFLEKHRAYIYEILDDFCIMGVLKAIKTPEKRFIKYVPANLSIFNDMLNLAKETIGLKRKK